MPVVKKYGARQVETAKLEGGQRSAAETALSMGAGVAQARGDRAMKVAEVGGMLTRIGVATYEDIRRNERRRAMEVRTLDWQNRIDQFELNRIYDPEKGALNLRGKDAFELPEDVDREYTALIGELGKGLKDPDEIAALQKLAQQRGGNIAMTVRRHVAGEIRTYENAQSTATMNGAKSLAIANAMDPTRVGDELHRGVTEIRRVGARNGMSPEAVNSAIADYQSDVHLGVIDNLLANDQEVAAEIYFGEAKAAGQIAGDKLDEVTKAIEEGSIRKGAQQKVDEILAAGGTLTEQRNQAKSITNPKLRDEVERRLEHERTVRDREEKETLETNMRGAYDVLDKTGDINQLTKTPAWRTFDGGTRSAMRHYAEQKARGAPIQTDWNVYYSLMQQAADDPNGFANDTNLLEDRDKLDDGEFTRLVELQRQIKTGKGKDADGTLAGFRTKQELLDDTLAQYGIDPKAAAGTPEGKAIAQLRRMLDRRIDAAQTPEGGKPQKVTNEEIQGALDSLLSQSETVPGSWWNIWPFGKPFFDESKRLIDVTIDDVPASMKTKITEKLRKARLPVSDQTILDTYIESRVK